jgi:hypothetical protein
MPLYARRRLKCEHQNASFNSQAFIVFIFSSSRVTARQSFHLLYAGRLQLSLSHIFAATQRKDVTILSAAYYSAASASTLCTTRSLFPATATLRCRLLSYLERH